MPLLPPADLTTRTTCRSCGAPLDPLLDLGTPVLSGFVRPTDPDPPSAPLTVVICQACDLVQLRHTVAPVHLYTDYFYRSGINEVMIAELRDVVEDAVCRVPLAPRMTVCDVGANDGTLLRCYPTALPWRIAVEPSTTFHEELHTIADTVLPGYFPAVTRGLSTYSIALLTTIACVYDLDDPCAAVTEADRLLTQDGLWIVQFQDLLQMVQVGAWDNIVHEHLAYYSLRTFEVLLNGVDLQVLDVIPRAINGGSLRVILGRRSQSPSIRVEAWRTSEDVHLNRRTLETFAWRAGQHRQQVAETVQYYAKDFPVDLYAASTKANTLLQWAGLDQRHIRQAAERSPAKVGLVTAGTRIPIVSEAEWRRDPAPISLVGAWQHIASFRLRERGYLRDGGAFLVPLPHVEVVTYGK